MKNSKKNPVGRPPMTVAVVDAENPRAVKLFPSQQAAADYIGCNQSFVAQFLARLTGPIYDQYTIVEVK